MTHRKDRYAGLRSLVRGETAEEAVREEFAHHLESRIEEYVAAGMTRQQAKEEAMRRLGDVDRYREETRRIDAVGERSRRRREFVGGVRREVRQALRSLRRSPMFTFVAVLTLGLGLGATGSIFTLLESVVLRPLPYPAADRLVYIASWATSGGSEGQWGISPAGYFHYRENQRTMEAFGVYSYMPLNISGEGDAVRVNGVGVSAGLLDVMGARPAAGRLLSEADDGPGATPVVMLSHGFWQRKFGGDPGIVGRTVNVNTRPIEVIGVLAEGTQLPTGDADVWLAQRLDPAGPFFNSHYLLGLGRLRAGETVASARSDLHRLTAQFADVYPQVYPASFMRDYGFRAEVHPLRDEVLGETTARTLWILFGSVGLVLLIACVNVANLFIVRSEIRRREVSVRTALGAERSDIVSQSMAESLSVAFLAGLLATGLVLAATGLVQRLSPPGIPRLETVAVRPATLAVTAGLALLSGLVLGLLPLLRRHGDASAVLRESGRGMSASRRQHRVRAVLVTTQFALALTLLAAAGLMLRSFQRLRQVDAGFVSDGLLTMSLALPSARYTDDAAVNTFYRELLERLEALPGVASAGLSSELPLEGGACGLLFVKDRPLAPGEQAPCLTYNIASPGYFETMGITLEGRAPTWDDEATRSGAVVVSRALAERYWPGESPLGRSIRPNNPGEPYYTITAVTGDVRTRGVDAAAPSIVYYPLSPMAGAPLWGSRRNTSVAVRARTGSPMMLLPGIRGVVSAMDADVPLANIQTMEAAMSRAIARPTFTMILLLTAAMIALVLSAVGLYGVISYVVGQRRPEIGIRIALGARPATVSRMVVRQSIGLALAGVAGGLVLTFAVTRMLEALLFEVSASDPLTLASVSVILLAIAIAASWIPARRAATVDPLEVIRNE